MSELASVEFDPTPRLREFAQWLKSNKGLCFENYAAMWRWSTTDLDAFWCSIWDYFDIASRGAFASVLEGVEMPGVAWFPGVEVNYVHQVMRHVDAAEKAGVPAVVAENEQGETTVLSWSELQRKTAALALDMRHAGVQKGDRVAAYLPNTAEAIIAFLATASLGAIWTLCSPDMGEQAVFDRFKQTAPKVLISVDGVFYAGRAMDRSTLARSLRKALTSVDIHYVITTGYGQSDIPNSRDFADSCANTNDEVRHFEPEWLPFDHPLWILYSSGTTGLPKAIVHGHGGILLNACAGHLHLDLRPSYLPDAVSERFHWYTASGWVMWNQQVSALLAGTTICLYDGSPSGPKGANDWSALWRFAIRHNVTWFGAGAAFFIGCAKAGLNLLEFPELIRVRALGSTGSPLPPEIQHWGTQQFDALGRANIWWSNISGGTDLFGAFMAGNRDLPPTPGGLQCRHLGAAVEAWDMDGQSLIGEVGELVCTQPIPSMPLFFWGDEDGTRYHASYFEHWPGVWRHGDWVRIDEDGHCTIAGRSDATINRYGLRMGTADIYAAVESVSEVVDSLVIDLEDEQGGSQLLMFIALAKNTRLDRVVEARMSQAIRAHLSPRFIPDHYILAPGIPRTLSGKKQELPIKRLFQGLAAEKVINPDTIANPEVIPWYLSCVERWRSGEELTGGEQGPAERRS